MSKILIKFIATLGMVLLSNLAGAQDVAEELYSRYESSVYRVEVVTPGVENKASVGTGFVIGRNDILASNYHVISNVVNEPDRYQLEWEGVDGRRGPLRVLAVDVVHDLAILQAEEPMGLPMQIADLPENGVSLFSLGHPLALDLAIVSGTNNGIQESSLYEKILFSGNINPGMSGGPTLDRSGQVVGVNVATSGEAVGYLVPATYLAELLAAARTTDFRPESDLATSISNQLSENQQSLVDEILSNEWRNISLGKLSVPGRVFDRLECWSDNQFEEGTNRYTVNASVCQGQDSIYLSEQLRAGAFSYEFYWLDSEQLSPSAFYQIYQRSSRSRFPSRPGEEDVGNFTCSTRFLFLSGQDFKANICARPYLDYPDLTDFMVLMTLVGHDTEGVIFTMDFSTVSLENGLAVLEKFLGALEWNPS
ncbi:serine protease [Gammaproteobacteria bacterium]|nr:serine protease [Gammaproteobacteria bacterium]